MPLTKRATDLWVLSVPNAASPHPSAALVSPSPSLSTPLDPGPPHVMSSYSSGTRTRTRAGFTLIELLTVIAIIGILAAILVPTVGKVRNTAKKAQCVSQMRQWGAATNLCANDYKSNIALFFTNGVFTYGPFLDNATNMNVTSQGGTVSRKSTIEAMSICPTGINGGSSLGNVRQYAFVIPVGLSAKNGKVFGVYEDVYFYKTSDAAAPAKLLLMIEVANQVTVNPQSLSGIQDALTADNSVRKMQLTQNYVRHGGLAHGLFLDGHIGSLSIADTDYGQSKDLLERYFSLK